MSLNARRTKRVHKPVASLENLSGQVTYSDGFVPKPEEVKKAKKPRLSRRFEVEFECAMTQRPVVPMRNTDVMVLNAEDLIAFTVPKRADRRIRSAERRVSRAALQAAIAAQKAALAHGEATKVYQGAAQKAVVKVTYRELQLAGKALQAREIAKQHGLR